MNLDGYFDVTKIKDELSQFYAINTNEDTLNEILNELERLNLINDRTNK